jgi:hypothetical protein
MKLSKNDAWPKHAAVVKPRKDPISVAAVITRQINISTDQEITIELQATRGANGYTATLGIMPRVGGAPAAAVDAPAAEPTKAAEPVKAAPKPFAKATLGIAPKATGLLLKAHAEADAEEETSSDPKPTQAYTGEDDGDDADEVENSMVADSTREEEPPMNEAVAETVKTADAPPPRSIFSKAKAG